MTEIKSNYNSPLALPRGPVIQPGKTVSVENWAGRKKHHHVKKLLDCGILEVVGNEDEPENDQDSEEGAGDSAYSVVDKGRGWHVVMKGGEEVTKSLRGDELSEFAGLSEEDKAAFVDLHPVKPD